MSSASKKHGRGGGKRKRPTRLAPGHSAEDWGDRIERIHQEPGVRASVGMSAEPPLKFRTDHDLETVEDAIRRSRGPQQ